MAKKVNGVAKQRGELPTAQIAFPGRSLLLISEVSKALKCTNQHVIDLVEEGQLVAVDIAGPVADPSQKPRRCLRIPVGSYDNFLHARTI